MMSTISNGVKRYPLITFFILTYALTLAFGDIPQMPLVAVIKECQNVSKLV